MSDELAVMSVSIVTALVILAALLATFNVI